MDWTSVIGSAVSVGSGGIFGLIGSAVGVVAKIYQKKQDRLWEEKKWEHEDKLLDKQMARDKLQGDHELAIVGQKGSWEGLKASINAAQSVKNVHMWVNDVKALFRPFLTILLWVLSFYIFFQIQSGNIETWLAGDTLGLIRYMVYSTFFCASSATMWWFGDRALTPPEYKSK